MTTGVAEEDVEARSGVGAVGVVLAGAMATAAAAAGKRSTTLTLSAGNVRAHRSHLLVNELVYPQNGHRAPLAAGDGMLSSVAAGLDAEGFP